MSSEINNNLSFANKLFSHLIIGWEFGKNMFKINKYCKLFSFKVIKLLLINVKKDKKPTESVTRKITAINIFSFINRNINLKSFKISYKFNYD